MRQKAKKLLLKKEEVTYSELKSGIKGIGLGCEDWFLIAKKNGKWSFSLWNLMLVNINRPLGAPGDLQADHSDGLTARDWGRVYLYGKHHQENLDTAIQSYKIG